MARQRNTALFDQIAARIEAEPDTYHQQNWAKSLLPDDPRPQHGCRTAFCVAGHAANLAGRKPRTYVCSATGAVICQWHYIVVDAVEEAISHDAFQVSRDPFEPKCRSVVHVAAELLGLSTDEAGDLFHSQWVPPSHETPAQALRRIGRGGEIRSYLVRPPRHTPAPPDPLAAASRSAQQIPDTPNTGGQSDGV